MEEYRSVGYTRKPVGIKGEIRLQIEDRFIEDVLRAQVLFLDLGGAPVPYFVEQVRMGKTPVAKLEEIDSPEAAATIAGKGMLLRVSDLIPDEEREPEPEEADLQFQFLRGYTLYNKDVVIGIIDEILEFPQQEMAQLQYQGRELLIPLNEQLIEQINSEQKTVSLNLPDGLLSL